MDAQKQFFESGDCKDNVQAGEDKRPDRSG